MQRAGTGDKKSGENQRHRIQPNGSREVFGKLPRGGERLKKSVETLKKRSTSKTSS